MKVRLTSTPIWKVILRFPFVCLKALFLLPRHLLILPILLYRKVFSPLKGSGCCRYTPTCSRYALEAILSWGAVIGLCLSLYRILRCQPFGRGGYDPVPVPPWKKRSEGPNVGGSDPSVGANPPSVASDDPLSEEEV